MPDLISNDGEVISERRSSLQLMQDVSAIGVITRAELDATTAAAIARPRNLDVAMTNITTLATLDEETASEMLYALVRRKKSKNRNQDQNAAPADEENKPIEGPSIRLAEIAAQCWKNNVSAGRPAGINRAEKYVEAEGIFIDVENNTQTKTIVQRSIRTSMGGIFSDDMIRVTMNAACSIAKRNAILGGIPKGVYRGAYLKAREMVAGKAEQLPQKRDQAIKAFATFGVTPVQLLEALDLQSEKDIRTDHIVTLRGMFAALKNGEETVETMFAKVDGGDHKKVENPLSDKPGEQGAAGGDGKPADAGGGKQAGAAKDKGGKGAGKGKAAETKGGDAKGAGAPDSAKEPAADTRTPEELAAAVDAAYIRGEKAKAAKMTRTVPKEFGAGREAEAQAYLDGFDGKDRREPGSEE